MATKPDMIAELEAKGAKLTGNETADELKAMLKPSSDSDGDEKEQGEDDEKEASKAKLAALEVENAELKKAPKAESAVGVKTTGEANADKPKQRSGDDDAAFDKTVNSVRKQLEAEEKRRILIPLMPGEPANTYQPFNINGYRVNVKKGVYVEVPATIADISEESFKQTEAAGTNLHSSLNGNNLKLDQAPQETTDALTFS